MAGMRPRLPTTRNKKHHQTKQAKQSTLKVKAPRVETTRRSDKRPPWMRGAWEVVLLAWTMMVKNGEAMTTTGGGRVCVCGSANVDLIASGGPEGRFPKAGETIEFGHLEECFGGKGANQAVQAARMGAAVEMVGKVGSDAFGERMTRNFQENGVGSAYVRQAEGPSGVALITVAENTNTIVLIPGANALLTGDDVRTASEILMKADVLLMQMEVPESANLAAMRAAPSAIKILNTAPATGVSDALLKAADVVCANEVELELMTGFSGCSDVPGAADAARALVVSKDLQCVVVTLGGNGALLVDPESAVHVPALARVPVVDTTGAGDSFLGALAAFLARGVPLHAAAQIATLCAGLAVQRPSTQPSYPTLAQLTDHYASDPLASKVLLSLHHLSTSPPASSPSSDKPPSRPPLKDRLINQPSSSSSSSASKKPPTLLSLLLDGSLAPYSAAA